MEKSIAVHRGSVRILRIFLSGIFLVAGFNHLIHTKKTVAKLEQAKFKGFAHFFGDPETLIILSGVVMLIAGLAFILGFYTRYAAIILALVLLPITLSVQVGQIETLGPLFKNIAIMGGLLFFIINKTPNILKLSK
ncbi:DoxX family protein [Christiangramia flava]|uniref:Uncharacterized protein n=1 Tax=Christiangramia flava JLT2011 TaxID=1229726 RepID=A0A1L7I7L6_9FLAO|nr:DoxX family protein [Christiangramia flava]APU69580.1 hypothetical protein GRFL_2856 [Christiangramia flava JLT2011]OSS39388.1 DoxX domain protein [Christiangramia flava JLT2011]